MISNLNLFVLNDGLFGPVGGRSIFRDYTWGLMLQIIGIGPVLSNPKIV
jgi:hypothetical protein